MAQLRIPSFISHYADGQATLIGEGKTVRLVLDHVIAQYPNLRNHLFDGDELRGFVNIYLGQDDIRGLQGLETAVEPDSVLLIIPSIAGG